MERPQLLLTGDHKLFDEALRKLRDARAILRTANTAILAGLLLAGIGCQEKKIERSDLPAAVERTVAGVSKDAIIKGFSKETENGKTIYEVDMVVSGHKKEVEMDAGGAIVEIEEQVAIDSLPPEVRAGLNANAGGGKIVEVESLTKNGKLVTYEAKVDTGGKTSEIQVSPDGKPLDRGR